MTQMTDFADWLQSEIDKRNWNRNTLAKNSGIDSGYISRILNRERIPGPDACESIARALGYPPELVYRAAGLLPPLHEPHTIAEEIARYKISELDDNQLEEVLRFIEFIQERDDRAHRREFIEHHTREGETPPKTVKKK